MKKLLLSALLLSTFAVQAQTFTCNSYKLYENNSSTFEYGKSDIKIESTEDMITVIVGHDGVTEFPRDYSEFRNNNGRITKIGNDFVLESAWMNNNHQYVPVKVIYQCK